MSSIENEFTPSNLNGEDSRGVGGSSEITGSARASSEHAASELVAGFFEPGGLLDTGDNDAADDRAALRWRQALLRLSETFLDAAEERRDLLPILLGALHNALEQLLIHGNEDDLMALEEWLSHEAPPPPPIEQAVSDAARALFAGEERRNTSDRRAAIDRRQNVRRHQARGRRNSDPSSVR